jgi:WD40 repeat protein
MMARLLEETGGDGTMRRPIWVRGLLWAMSLPFLVTAAGQPPPARRPQMWAVVVGIDNYTHPTILDGQTAARNAGDVAQWFRRAGWDRDHQLLLRDFGNLFPGTPDAPAPSIRPIKQNLDWALQKWLVSKAQPGDLVIFYFAGQARALVRPENPRAGGLRIDPRVDYYLLPADATPDSPGQSGWSLDQAVDVCARRKLQVVCWLATSLTEQHEGPIPPAPPIPADGVRPAAPKAVGPAAPGLPAPPVSTGVHWLAHLARWPGVTAWLASDRPRSIGSASDPGAIFTTALLGALGKPDPERKSKQNLAACLKDLHQNPELKLLGFTSVGGVPPSLTLWESEFGKPVTVPKPELVLQVGHADKITAVAAPADGRQIMTASLDSTIRIWSAADRSLLRVLPGQSVGVTALQLTRDDALLISGGGRGAIQVYDRRDDFSIRPLAAGQPHAQRIHQIALLPDGYHFVSIDRSGSSFLWDARESPLAPRPWLPGTVCQELACGGRLDPDGDDTGIILARCGDGTVRVFDSAGGGGAVLQLPQEHATAVAVSPDGSKIAAGFADGVVVVRDLKAQSQDQFQAAKRPVAIRTLVFSPAGPLAVSHESGAYLVGLRPRAAQAFGQPARISGPFDLVDQPVQCLAFSPSGEHLATCTENVGALKVWRVDGEKAPVVTIDEGAAKAFTIGFTGNNRGLIFGDFEGGLAFRPLDPQADEVPWTFPANRGKVQQLSATASRRFLLFLDEQRHARIWDLKERTCRRLPGTWSSGVLLDDERLILVPDAEPKDLAGRLVLVDRDRLTPNPTFFARSAGAFKLADTVAFERIVLSTDGSRVAASSDEEPIVCVWETKSGRLTHWMGSPQLADPASSLSFSSDARSLLTGGDSPQAQLWDLSAPEGSLAAPVVTFADPMVKNNLTCAAIRPGDARQVVTGHSDGQVHVWRWAGDKPRLEVLQLVAGAFAGAVKALCFTSAGRQLAAAGDGTQIWIGEMEPRPRATNTLRALRPHHYEEINALAAWHDLPILISGSDDTTIRFWDLKRGSLWGTFSATTRPPVAEAAIQELDWVLYTPEGRYDAPPSATALVRFRRHNRPLLVDQFEKTHNTFRLSERMLQGEDPRLGREPEEPPPVSISVPPRTDPTTPRTRVTITLGARDAKEIQDVRLYQNDVPIPCGWEAQRQHPSPDLSFEVDVRLAPNRNRFYVMASREGAYDSCSKVVEVDYAGPSEPGRLHVLALGVGSYRTRGLLFARRDAEQLSQVLHARGLDAAGESGYVDVLRDEDVNRENITSAFARIAERVEDRPQDTVVVFLAGHTGVFRGLSFCLLLPTFPFPAKEPVLVAARDATTDVEEEVNPDFVLPYSFVALNLMRLKALHRLVIVDACQAEAIYQDPKVRSIQKWMDLSSRGVRTSYLMAARRGEPALEVEPLGHGLFTYTLLRGMGAIPLTGEPKLVSQLNLPGDGDYNKDGVLSTAELDAYAKDVLPRLTGVFPQLLANARAAVDARSKTPVAPRPKPEAEPAPRMQGAEVSFPLVPLAGAQNP